MKELTSLIKDALSIDWDPSFDGDLDYKAPQVPVKAQAAVMILVNQYQSEPTITLTLRTDSLKKHSGQVAFPGGRIDAEDTSPWHAAVRETHEEIGMPLNHPLKNMGTLSPHTTITGYLVKPFVAVNHNAFEYFPEESEVADIFEIPFSLLQPAKFEIGSQDWRGEERRYFVLPYKEYFIWGATARMLHQLALRIEYVQRNRL